jgi:YesN/AraC family two-component response regulator
MIGNVDFSDGERRKIDALLQKLNPESVASSGSTLSSWISERTGIPKRSVSAYLANQTRERNLKLRELDDNKRERIEELLLRGIPYRYEQTGVRVSEWISKRTKIPIATISAYIANLSRTKNRVLIVESTFESIEDKSESKHLEQLLRICNWNGAIKSRIEKLS